MAITIESPKLMSVRLTKLLPKDMKNNFVYTYDATIDVTTQLHSGTTGFTASQYDARDINVGDYIATTSKGRVLKISEIKSTGPTRLECILIDEDQINSATDETQYGESAIDTDDGILFELREGRPYLFPLPDVLPGGLTEEFAIQIASRFNFANKEKNINVEQLPHGFVVGETLTLTANGWVSTTNDPTGVVVKADDDSFSVRLFGTKTHMELPGSVGDVYYWDTVDRILTTTPGSNSVKLFQKLAGNEALLLDGIGGGSGGSTSGGSGFTGNYNDLFNTPVIPNDVSQLTDSSGLLQHITKTSELTNDSSFVTQNYVDQQIANVSGGGNIDLSGYATDADLTASAIAQQQYTDTQIAAIQTFSGDYADLVNAPAIPDVTGFLTEAEIDAKIANIDVGGHFSGDYNDLTNKPAIPNTDNLATVAYVDQQIADIDTGSDFSGSYNDLTDKPALFSGNYNELYNRPAIPTNVSDLTNDVNYLTTISNNLVINALGYTPQNQATAFNGDYNSLINKPTIPDVTGLASEAYVDQQIANVAGGGNIDLSGYVTDSELATQLANYQPTIDLSNYYTRTQVDGLIPTVFSGDYNDLTNKPAIPTVPTDISQLTDTTNLLSGGGNVDLTGYATQTYVNNQISSAVLSAGGISNLNDLNDVAVGSLPQVDNANEYYLLEYNPVNALWESRDFGSVFATQSYVSATIATAVTDGNINLDGYATEQYVEQKLLERGDHFSGNYNDLTNTPILFSGDYRDLVNAPADNSDLRLMLIGDELQLLNIEPEPDTVISTVKLDDLGAAVSSYINYENVQNLPNIFSGNYNDLINRPNLFSGNYNDLANKPYIPSIAGLASTEYVDNRIAEPTITGDRTFTHEVTFNQDVEFKETTKISSATGEHENQVMSLQTTDAVVTEALNAQGGRIAIEPNSTMMFEVHVIGATATAHFGVKIKGIVNNTLGTTTMIGSPSFEILAQEGNTWDAQVSADDTNDNLKITVQGETGVTVDWTIFTEINKVKR